MEFVVKPVLEMSAVEYIACESATFGDEGMMQDELWRVFDESDSTALAVMCWDNASLIGWALLTAVSTDRRRYVYATSYTKRKSKYTVQIFVNEQYRRQGYGKAIMKKVLEQDPRPHVLPHDVPSAELFSSFNVTVLQEDKWRMNYKKPKAG